MNHKNMDELRNIFTPQGTRSPLRGPIDKSIDTGAKGNISIKYPYHPIAKEQMKVIQKYQNKINQEARKELVLSQVANPKVSEL